MLRVINRINFLRSIKSYLSNNPICAEIGVHKGVFSQDIFNELNPAKLYLIDPWTEGADKNSPTQKYTGSLNHLYTAYSTNEDLISVKKIFAKELDTKVFINKNFSYDAVSDFDNNYFDFIYIDATHIYESVKADLTMYYPKLKHNGLLCGHDYTNHPSFSVIPAVDEFMEQYNGKMIVLSNTGDFAIKFNG